MLNVFLLRQDGVGGGRLKVSVGFRGFRAWGSYTHIYIYI